MAIKNANPEKTTPEVSVSTNTRIHRKAVCAWQNEIAKIKNPADLDFLYTIALHLAMDYGASNTFLCPGEEVIKASLGTSVYKQEEKLEEAIANLSGKESEFFEWVKEGYLPDLKLKSEKRATTTADITAIVDFADAISSYMFGNELLHKTAAANKWGEDGAPVFKFWKPREICYPEANYPAELYLSLNGKLTQVEIESARSAGGPIAAAIASNNAISGKFAKPESRG